MIIKIKLLFLHHERILLFFICKVQILYLIADKQEIKTGAILWVSSLDCTGDLYSLSPLNTERPCFSLDLL
jgi:hypothetical protein